MLLTKLTLPLLRHKPISYIFPKAISNLTYTNIYQISMNKVQYNFSTDVKDLSPDLQDLIQNQTTIEILRKKGISSFFPIQVKTFNHIYEGKDIIAGEKTGSGKTIAFTLPVLEKLRKEKVLGDKKGIKFVVISPTRELAVQIGTQISSLKHSIYEFKVTTVFGGTPVSLNLKQLHKKPDILVGTPGRILDLMQRGQLNLQDVRTVCVDEADFMFDIGFQEHLDEILGNIKKSSPEFQLLCFSATLNREVVSLTEKFMQKDKIVLKMNKQTAAPTTIQHFGVKVTHHNRILALRHLINNHSNNGRVIIFANTKKIASQISSELKVRNVVLHGDIPQAKRLERLQQFKKGNIKVLIATDVAARGLDIPNVELVINNEFPSHYESYVHRSGRTGRAGKNGKSMTLVSNENSAKQILDKLKTKTNIHIKKIQITENEYEEVENQNMKQEETELFEEQPEKKTEKISEKELILFDIKDKINKEELSDFLKHNGKKFKYIKQCTSNKTGNKFFVINFDQEQEAKNTLHLKIPLENEKYTLRFMPKIIKEAQSSF